MTAPAALDALDRLLALRPDDLDDATASAAAAVPAVQRAAIEADDAVLTDAIAAWGAADLGQPSFTAADLLARAAAPDGLPTSFDRVERPTSGVAPAGPATGGTLPPWLVPVAIAASIAALAFGAWRVSDVGVTDDARPKSLVSDESAARVSLQFSVEDPTGIAPGRNGGTYGPEHALAFRFDLAGEAGHLALVEIDGTDWSVVYPLDGGTVALDPGAHVLSGADGDALVYRPDDPAAGTLEYVAVVLSEPVDVARVVPGLLAAGLHRADLWPRPVAAVDAVTVTWEAR